MGTDFCNRHNYVSSLVRIMKLDTFEPYDISLPEDMRPRHSYHDGDDRFTEPDDYNYEEEAWYAMTDGQYGDYPGGTIDYDFLGY